MSKKKSYYKHERTDLLSLVPENSGKILDVGCGEGLLGKRIKDLYNNTHVTGIELNKTSCEEAEKNIDQIICGNIETLDLPFEKDHFDCIITGDVLEHLVDPWETLKRLGSHLKNNGVIISSIPNIRYYKALIRLFRGYWDYTDAGIFDKTHLRFFCLINIREMFENSGFEIDTVERNIVSARGFRLLNYLSLNHLKDFLTYQYYIVARKSSTSSGQKKKRQPIQF